MAVVEHETSLDGLRALASHISGGIRVAVTSVYVASTDVGLVLGLNVQKSDTLAVLHAESWSVFASLPRLDATNTSVLADAQVADPVTLAWINNFHKGTGAAWSPHVTLGFGPGHLDQYMGHTLRFDKLALYQLGGYCTCQRLVWEVVG
jgi:hypothetical protein